MWGGWGESPGSEAFRRSQGKREVSRALYHSPKSCSAYLAGPHPSDQPVLATLPLQLFSLVILDPTLSYPVTSTNKSCWFTLQNLARIQPLLVASTLPPYSEPSSSYTLDKSLLTASLLPSLPPSIYSQPSSQGNPIKYSTQTHPNTPPSHSQ